MLTIQMYLRKELGDGTLGVMKTLKIALDPKGIMNPGKVRQDSSGVAPTVWADLKQLYPDDI